MILVVRRVRVLNLYIHQQKKSRERFSIFRSALASIIQKNHKIHTVHIYFFTQNQNITERERERDFHIYIIKEKNVISIYIQKDIYYDG